MTIDISPFENAISRLEEGLTRYQSDTRDTQIRDGLVQRFEFIYELGFKMLKRYLEFASRSPWLYSDMAFQDVIRAAAASASLDGALPDAASAAAFGSFIISRIGVTRSSSWMCLRRMRERTTRRRNNARLGETPDRDLLALERRMSKAGERLIEAMRNVIDIMDGKADPAAYKVHIFDDSDVCAIRLKLGLSQAKFAARYGFSLDTVRKWEQKTRKPSGAALTLLRVIAKHPEIVESVLAA